MDNYIVINGKKVELTKEQLVALGIENEVEIEKENPFDFEIDIYWFIDDKGKIIYDYYCKDSIISSYRYKVANYCGDKELMRQRALHETLNRLLWRYSMLHEGDKIDWNNAFLTKYGIYYNFVINEYLTDMDVFKREGKVYFISEEVAKDAIEEVVKPFIKQHPEFEW